MPATLGREESPPREEFSSKRQRHQPQEARVVKLGDVLHKARGTRYLGLEQGIWVFVLAHTVVILVLIVCNTYLADRVQGLRHTPTWTDCSYVLCVLLALTAHTYLYCSLFGSDPGWVPRTDYSDGPPGHGICSWCRASPPLRARHDHRTGQCVAKFDHFCPILGTSIGDCNHAGFWTYNATQTFIALWGLVLALQSSAPCLWSNSPEIQAACWQGIVSWTTLRTVALLVTSMLLAGAANLFAGLWSLHTLLAATGQTTYEALKGPEVPYLAPFYEGYMGPRRPLLRGNHMQLLLMRYLMKQPPPTPFSQGALNNLNIFLFAPKPYEYKIRQQPASASNC